MLAVYNREVEMSRVSSRSHAEDARLERPCTAGCRRVGGATPSCTRAAGVEGTDVCLAVVDMRPITPPALQETAPQSHTKRHRSSVVGRRRIPLMPVVATPITKTCRISLPPSCTVVSDTLP